MTARTQFRTWKVSINLMDSDAVFGRHILQLEVAIVEMETMPDHIHIFVKSKPTYAPHFLVQQFKGYSSRVLREEFAELRSRLPSLWTRSYFCESVGCISADAIIRYIENQKKH